MPPVKPQRNYNCTQNELYLICRIAWHNCNLHLPAFAACKTTYTPSRINEEFHAIASAMNLPDEVQRDSVEKNSYREMVQAGEACLSKWRMLRCCINAAFPPEYAREKIKAAGKAKYKLALNGNWVQLQGMMSEGKNFLAENKAILVNHGMPVGFESEFMNAESAFSRLYLKYKGGQHGNRGGTVRKIQATNALYDNLQVMLRDAQVVFEKNPVLRKKFVFTELKKLVTRGNQSGNPAASLIVDSVPVKITKTPLRKLPGALLQRAGSFFSLF